MKHIVSLAMNRFNPKQQSVDLTLLPAAMTQYLLFCLDAFSKNTPIDHSYQWGMLLSLYIQDSYLVMIKHSRYQVFNEEGAPTQASFYGTYKLLMEMLDEAYRQQIHFILEGIDKLGKVTELSYITHNSHQILFEVTFIHLLPHLTNNGY